jgi:hypothetical protein
MNTIRLLIFLASAAAIFQPVGTSAQAQAPPTITVGGAPNTYNLTWSGVAGRVYFLQISTDLETWEFSPMV